MSSTPGVDMRTFLSEPNYAAFVGHKKDRHFGLSTSVLKMKGQLSTVAFH